MCNRREIGKVPLMRVGQSWIWSCTSVERMARWVQLSTARIKGPTGLSIDSITISGKSLQFEMKSLGANYEGVFSTDGSQIEGQFSQQRQRLPLTFKRIGKNDSSESVLKLQKVDVGGHGLQLLVGGQVSPAAIFEGGFGTGIASWSTVQKDVLLLLKRSHMIVLVSVSLIWD